MELYKPNFEDFLRVLKNDLKLHGITLSLNAPQKEFLSSVAIVGAIVIDMKTGMKLSVNWATLIAEFIRYEKGMPMHNIICFFKNFIKYRPNGIV